MELAAYVTLPIVLLTIREAAAKTGHSPHKIRRLIKAIAEQPVHVERSEIEPSPSDVQRLTMEGVQFTWRVSEELVRRQLGDTPIPSTAENDGSEGGGVESSNLLSLLQTALDAKEQAEARLFEQLRVKDGQIASLNERLRESNLLMASLQKQLPERTKTPMSIGEPTKAAPVKRPEKGIGGPAKSKQQGWLRKFFA